MNSTIISLVSKSISHSPFFSLGSTYGKQYFSLSKIAFRNQFSHVLYSSTSNANINFRDSSFKNFLSSAVHFGRAYSIRYKSFIQLSGAFPIILDQDFEASFLHCNFERLFQEGNGGALSSELLMNSIHISQCDFQFCEASENGGTFYLLSRETVFHQCCISTSSAKKNYSVGYAQCDMGRRDKSKVLYDCVSICGNGINEKTNNILAANFGIQEYTYSNFSDNFGSQCSSIQFLNQQAPIIHYVNFARNSNGNLIHIPVQSASNKEKPVFNSVNIFFNNCSYSSSTKTPLFEGRLSAALNKVYFRENGIKLFFKDYGQSMIIFDDCYFDTPKSFVDFESDDELHGEVIVFKNCIFELGPKMTQLNIPFTNDEVCYITQRKMPFTNPAVLNSVVINLTHKLNNPHLVAGIIFFTFLSALIIKKFIDHRNHGRRPSVLVSKY